MLSASHGNVGLDARVRQGVTHILNSKFWECCQYAVLVLQQGEEGYHLMPVRNRVVNCCFRRGFHLLTSFAQMSNKWEWTLSLVKSNHLSWAFKNHVTLIWYEDHLSNIEMTVFIRSSSKKRRKQLDKEFLLQHTSWFLNITNSTENS